MLDRALGVRAVVSGLNSPIGVAFLTRNEMLVLEKDTGRVQLVVDGMVAGTVLDLGVNSNSERGLLGVALQHPYRLTAVVHPWPFVVELKISFPRA